LIEADLLADPYEQFRITFARAVEVSRTDPTAMVLSTATPDGRPSSRVVLLKNHSARGFTFFTNYESRKSVEMISNPHAALNFYWPELGQQVRIEGLVEQDTPEASDAYYGSRARISQMGAWASEQSRPLESREALLQRLQNLEEKFRDMPVPRPPHWGGWLLRPKMFEFWYDGEFRLHDRFVYSLEGSDQSWKIERLNP
jgi:pyridoxamine 5'-phosphate oxidase